MMREIFDDPVKQTPMQELERDNVEQEVARLRAINARLLEACGGLIAALAEHWKAWDNKGTDEMEACRLGREAIAAAKGEQ